MAWGTVKWFDQTKGYGFIQPESGGRDVFVHVAAVHKAGLGKIDQGMRVSYDLVTSRNGNRAENLGVGAR